MSQKQQNNFNHIPMCEFSFSTISNINTFTSVDYYWSCGRSLSFVIKSNVLICIPDFKTVFHHKQQTHWEENSLDLRNNTIKRVIVSEKGMFFKQIKTNLMIWNDFSFNYSLHHMCYLRILIKCDLFIARFKCINSIFSFSIPSNPSFVEWKQKIFNFHSEVK